MAEVVYGKILGMFMKKFKKTMKTDMFLKELVKIMELSVI